MYFRTCWYTKRYRLTIYLTIAVALTILGVIPEALEYRAGHWIAAVMTPERAAHTWAAGVEHTVTLLLVVLLFAGADLGALALGDGSKRRDLDFLITRPRPRRYFIWTSWLAGLTELVSLLILPSLTSLLVLFYMTHIMLPGQLLPRSVALFAIAAAMYTLVFLLATLTGSAQNGFQFAALVILIYYGYNYAQSAARSMYLHLRGYTGPPYGSDPFGWFEVPYQLFPFAHLLFLLALTLALPLLAQAGFERRDL